MKEDQLRPPDVVRVFICYAREDAKHRDALVKHLRALEDAKVIDLFHDREISAGRKWSDRLERELDESHLVLALVSPDFMASEYCRGVEIKRAIERQRRALTRIVPVVVRPVDWSSAAFADNQAIPTDARPITKWDDADEAWLDCVKHIQTVCLEIRGARATPFAETNPYVYARVGDWIEYEMFIQDFTTGQAATVHNRIELLEKDEENDIAVTRATITGPMGQQEQRMEVPLDMPLPDTTGILMQQTGQAIPNNAAIRIEDLESGEDKLFVGTRAYDCKWVRRRTTLEVQGQRVEVLGTNWRSPKVPLDQLVRTEMELPGARITLVLTGHSET